MEDETGLFVVSQRWISALRFEQKITKATKVARVLRFLLFKNPRPFNCVPDAV